LRSEMVRYKVSVGSEFRSPHEACVILFITLNAIDYSQFLMSQAHVPGDIVVHLKI